LKFKTIIKNNVGPEWNEQLQKHPFATFHQTSNFAEYWMKTRGQPSYFVYIMKKNEIAAQMLITKNSLLQRRLENTFPQIPFSSSLFSIIKNIKPIFIWEYGPIIFHQNDKSEIFQEINKLKSIFKGPINGSLHPFESPTKILSENKWKESKSATFIIDLRLPLEQLWKNVDHSSGRKAVNRAKNKGLKIKQINSIDDLRIHHSLLNEGREIASLPKFPFRNVESIWNIFQEIGITGFIVWLDDVPLASTLMTIFNGYINEMGFARSKIDIKKLYNATDLIKWHIIEWGHETGLKTFDLSGTDPYSSDKKSQGIFKFKKKWGGTIKDWHHYTLI
jgi:hypothetical protein